MTSPLTIYNLPFPTLSLSTKSPLHLISPGFSKLIFPFPRSILSNKLYPYSSSSILLPHPLSTKSLLHLISPTFSKLIFPFPRSILSNKLYPYSSSSILLPHPLPLVIQNSLVLSTFSFQPLLTVDLTIPVKTNLFLSVSLQFIFPFPIYRISPSFLKTNSQFLKLQTCLDLRAGPISPLLHGFSPPRPATQTLSLSSPSLLRSPAYFFSVTPLSFSILPLEVHLAIQPLSLLPLTFSYLPVLSSSTHPHPVTSFPETNSIYYFSHLDLSLYPILSLSRTPLSYQLRLTLKLSFYLKSQIQNLISIPIPTNPTSSQTPNQTQKQPMFNVPCPYPNEAEHRSSGSS